MKFNVEKLKSEARELTKKERAEMEYRAENADWLRLSATIALKIRKFLRLQGISQTELASRLGVSAAQVSKLLSGKVNFEIKTLTKIERVLGRKLLEVSLNDQYDNFKQVTATNVASEPTPQPFSHPKK